MNNPRIPNAFYLFGIKYTVRFAPRLINDNDNLGEAGYRSSEIIIQERNPSLGITEERQLQVFYHELVHIILHEMHSDLRDDEKFVDMFASLLHQYATTEIFTVEDM